MNRFGLKSLSFFSPEGVRGRGQLRVQERRCSSNKIASLLHSIMVKNKIQETTLVILVILTITKPDYQ